MTRKENQRKIKKSSFSGKQNEEANDMPDNPMWSSDPMSLHDSLSLLGEAFGHYQTLWGAYVAVAFGVVTVATSIKFPDRLTRIVAKVIITAVFLLFARLNWGALEEMRDNRDHLAEYSQKSISQLKDYNKEIDEKKIKGKKIDEMQIDRLNAVATIPPTYNGLAAVVVILSLGVVALIIFAPNAREESSTNLSTAVAGVVDATRTLAREAVAAEATKVASAATKAETAITDKVKDATARAEAAIAAKVDTAIATKMAASPTQP